MAERFSYRGHLPFNHVSKKIYPLLIHEADYIKMSPNLRLSYFFLSLLNALYLFMFLKKGLHLHLGKVHSTDPKSNPEHSRHLI